MIAYLIIGAVVLERLCELIYAERNTRALIAQGATEVGRTHYPLIVLLHAAWLLTVALSLPDPPRLYWIPLGVFLLLQAARIWVLATLGRYWTTRIITLESAPLITRGPYRFLRHPNYAVVIGEIAVFPLVFGEIWVAVVFSVANAALLWWRIGQEDAALETRRKLSR